MILNEVAVDGVAHPAFERPPGLGRRLGNAEFALIELSAWAVGADLADRDQVHGAVELTVSARESRWRRCSPLEASIGGAAVAGVVVAAREARDRAGVSDDLRGQYRPD